MTDETPIELLDLGDAAEETKQCSPMAVWPDSWYGWGSVPWQTPEDQCPR